MIVFLGNPGAQYAGTRHNVGWMVADELAPADAYRWKEKFGGVFVREGERVLLKPHTFMNRSGFSVQPCAAFFSITPDAIALVHDDMESAFGATRLEFGGGLRGHKGLRSVREQLGTDAFWRLRVGIGRPRQQRPGAYVLERFSAEEEARLPEVIGEAARLLRR